MNSFQLIKQLRAWGLKGALTAIMRKSHDFTVARYLAKSARKYSGYKPTKGITIVANMRAANSLSKAIRDFAYRLKEVGIPFQVFDTCQSDGKVDKSDYEEIVPQFHDFNIMRYTHIVEMLTSPLPSGIPLTRCRIAFWEGEAGILDVFPYLKDADYVIAMSDYNAAYYEREFRGSVKVAKVLYPLMSLPIDVMQKDEARRRFGIAHDDFVVFYNFDVRARGRKNLDGTLSAFSKAFRGNIQCKLVLKVNGADDEKKNMLLRHAEQYDIREQLVIITQYLSETDLYSLTNACDVYLSLHRAEGFGLGMAEAMQLGKAVIATAYSANTEFCKDDNSILVPYKLIPIEDTGFQKHMKTWAEPNVEVAANALRRLKADNTERDRLGVAAREFVTEYFSSQNFTKSIEDLICKM